MSAEDFQTKYASVMESMLKSAIAETTKLFETMVDDLKAEISRIKKENEDLKTRCSLFEKGKSQTRESESSPRSSDGSEKRDTAVQCDLVPFRTMLVEQCLPLRNSSVEQEQEQCSYEEMEYGLQEHNYETHSQMAFILVKQESIMKQEEVEPANACGKASNAGLPQATAFGTENEGRGTIPEKNGEIQVALELPCLGMHRGFQRAPNQSSEPEQALVISFTAINDGMEDETREGLVTSGEQSVMTVQQQSLVSQQRQRETESTTHCKEEPLAQPKPQNKEVACEDFKSGIAEVEATLSQPLRRRRGRPPKKAKHLQRPVKPPSTDVTTEQMVANSPSIIVEEVEISTNTSSFITPNTASGDVESIKVGALAVSVASVSRECSTEKKKTPESQQQAVEKESASTQDSSATETLNSTPAESRQAPSVHPRVRRTSVTLQDAMLLVEAMNQSPEENTISSSKRMAAPPQSQRATRSRTLQTVDEVVAEPQMLPFPTQSRETAGKLPIESAAQSTIKGARPQITNSTPSNEAQACIKGVVPKQQHAVTHPFNTASQPMPSSTAATQTCIRSQLHLPYPLQTSAAASEQSNAVPHKIIVVPRSVPSLICNKIAELCPTKLPTFASTVVAAQNNNLNPPSPAAHLPVGTPSFSPVPKKRIYVSSRKLLPVVLSQSTATSTDQQPGILPHPNMTITIPRHGQAVASRTPQPILISRKRASAEPAGAVTLSSSQLLSPSQELTFSVEAQTTSDKMASISSQKWDNTTDHKESPKQTETLSDFTTNAPTETCPSLKTGLVPASLSQVEQKLCPMVRLTKLPFSVLIKESVLVSKVLPNGCSETQPLWKEGSTQEKLLSADISTKPSEVPLVAPGICPSLKEASVSTQTPQMSKEQNNIQEIALSSDTCTVLGESYVSVYEHPSTPPKMIASVLEKSAEPSASNVVEEIFSKAMQGCALPNGFPTEDKESADLVQLTSNKSKDLSDPESHLTKTQFLAQLAVLPVIPAPEKASSNDCADNRAPSAETCNTGKKRLQKKSLVAQLQSHFKTHVQTRGTKRNPEPCTEIETTSVSHKRLGSKNNSPNYKQVTNKPDPISPKKPGVVEDMTSLNKTTNDHVPNSLRRTGRCKGAFRPKRSVSEPTRRSKATRESTPRRCSSGRDGIGSKNTKSTSVSPQRSSPSKDDDHPRNTKNGTSPKNIKCTSVSAKRTGLTREGASLKKTEHSAVSPGTSSLSENGTSPKLSAHELIYINRTRSTFTQDSSNTKQIKRESSSFSPLRRTTGTAIAKTKSETYSPSIRWPQLAKDGELTPAKKIARLIQDGTTPKKNARILNARKLAKAAKAKTIAKMQKGAKTGQLTEGQVSSDVLKKYKAKAVWIPPKITASKTPSASAKRPCLLHVKKETRSPKSQNHSIVYPPSVSLQPIPVKAPPIISPLQPLSVIGGRLLKNQCGECGRVLSSSAALESHVSLHTGRRPYSCTLCGKSFPDPKGLKRHGRVHRNGRIHICQQCGKGFVYSFGLTKHLQMVHSRIKPFVCQICNKGFYTKRDVEAHIRIHTGEKPFHCNLCEKKFTRRVELNVHLRWHNGEKRHWCPFCGKGFLDLNNLKRHKYIHTGEKPHSCPHCPKHFTQSGHLKKHVKNVHKIQ